MSRSSSQKNRFFKGVFKWLAWLVSVGIVAFVVADGIFLARIWPDWENLKSGPIPESAFITDYRARLNLKKRLPDKQWRPVPLWKIPVLVQKAFIVAEDGRFYQHAGIDLQAIKYAFQENWRQKRIKYGASTISQQTVKNLFLSSDRTFLRKWHELLLTKVMESKWNKSRILEIYLNDAQLGNGVFGVAAAADLYWGKPLYQLSARQAAELAACLPSPARNSPSTRTSAFQKRADAIHKNLLIVLGQP